MKLNQEALEHGSVMPLSPEAWALSILRWAAMSDWPDPLDYACWVRSVAMAGAMGNQGYLRELENKMLEQVRGFARRANEKADA